VVILVFINAVQKLMQQNKNVFQMLITIIDFMNLN